MNVCSYESQSPESNPEDCVREPDTGTITIVKDAVPDYAQDFTFDPSSTAMNGGNNFLLDDDVDPVLPNQRLFSALPATPNGTTYSVTEMSIPAGWVLTNIVCTGGTGVLIGADSDFDAGDTAVSIPLKPLENVICTYTNEQVPPTVTVDKIGQSDHGERVRWAGDVHGRGHEHVG